MEVHERSSKRELNLDSKNQWDFTEWRREKAFPKEREGLAGRKCISAGQGRESTVKGQGNE